MTTRPTVIPAKAGTQLESRTAGESGFAAVAGMTGMRLEK